jgi:hypothetical protein
MVCAECHVNSPPSRGRVRAHIKKLDDYFGQFLVRVSCPLRRLEPQQTMVELGQ